MSTTTKQTGGGAIEDLDVIIVGAGFAGLYVAVKVPPHVDLIKTAICTRRDP